jgi:signal transduction histidine kinase
MTLSTAIKFNRGIILANIGMGNTLGFKGQYFKALQSYKNALPYCQGSNTYLNALLYNNIGNIHIYMIQYDIAVQAFLKAVEYSFKYSGHGAYPLESIYQNLSVPFNHLRQYNKALHYLDLAYNISFQKQNYAGQALVLVNKGNIYQTLNNISQSELLYDSAITLAQKNHLWDELFYGLINSGNLYLESGNADKALERLSEAHTLVVNNHLDIYQKVSTYLLLGKVYTRRRNYSSAQYWLDKAWQKSKTLPYKQAELLRYYSELYEAQGQNDLAIEKLKAFMTLKDSIDNNERSNRIAELETQYRTAEKDREIAEKQLQITRQQASLRQSRLLMTAGIIISLLLVMLLILSRRSIKNKHARLAKEAETKTLEAVIVSEQKERNRIAMELHDGIVSDLTAVKLNLEITRSVQEDIDTYKASLRQLGTAIHDIRNTAHNLMPEILLRHHLEEAVKLLCAAIERTGRLEIRFLSYGDFTQIKMEIRQAIYRIIQELLHNIIKHAKADKTLVQLSCYETLFTATIEDNGIGLDLRNKTAIAGMGFKSLENRVQDRKGRITYGASGFGTGLSVYIELDI